MRTAARGLAAAMAAASMLACGEPGGLAFGPAESAVVTVRLEPGSPPLYSWTEAAGRRLVVTGVPGGEVIWDIRALDAALGFSSPVEHGLVPLDAEELVIPRLLNPGVRHRVEVTLVGGGQATAEFIP